MHLVARLIMQILASESGVAETETRTIRPRRSFKLRGMESQQPTPKHFHPEFC